MKKLISFLGVIAFLVFPTSAHAVCPVCTIAVGAGLGLSRWLGIDDSITGLWIGGLILSSGLWLAEWIRKKGWKIPYPDISSIILMGIFVIPPLFWSKTIGLSGNTLWGMDKVLFGTLIGSIAFILGVGIDTWLRTTHEGRVYIYYQKVILPVFFLALISFIFYLITG